MANVALAKSLFERAICYAKNKTVHCTVSIGLYYFLTRGIEKALRLKPRKIADAHKLFL